MHVDIDECASNPCGEGGACSDGVDTYDCECLTGWTGDNCETGPHATTDHDMQLSRDLETS